MTTTLIFFPFLFFLFFFGGGGGGGGGHLKLTMVLLEVVLYKPDVMGDFINHST